MKTKKKTLIILAISVIAVVCMALSGMMYSLKRDVYADFSGGELNEEYFVGETVEIPSATFTLDGTTVEAKAKLIYPDNSVYNVSADNSKFKVSDYGIYTVQYSALINGKAFEQLKTFKVNMKLFEINGVGTAEYGDYSILNTYMAEHKADFMSTGDARDKYTELQNNDFIETFSGIKVALGAGSTFNFNKVIDLRDLESETPLISLQITPTNIGETDFRRINIKVTDVYDPTNYILIRMKDKENDDGEYLSYTFVSVKNDYKYYTGTTQRSNAVYGLSVRSSFRGQPGLKNNAQVLNYNTYYADDYISFYLDEETNMVYKKDTGNRENNTITSLCDLIGINAGFDGFTTGEVKLEIYGEIYSSTYANFVIRDIAGENLAEVNKVIDNEAPSITINYGDLDAENLPNGCVGLPYQLLKATAYDTVDGAVAVKPYVYRNYYTDSRISVPVIDGKFYPTEEDVYTICYTAVDKYKNKVEEPINVKVVKELSPITFALSNRSTAENPMEEAVRQGESYSLALAKDVNGSFGGFGLVEISAEVIDVNKEKVIFSFEDATKLNKVRFMEMGEYKVVYTATDYVGQSLSLFYTVRVIMNNKAVIMTDVESELLPSYILGYSYVMPAIKAYSFKIDGTYEEINADVSVDNGSITNDGAYIPEKEGEVVFTFSCGTVSESAVRKVYSIKSWVKTLYDDEDEEIGKIYVDESENPNVGGEREFRKVFDLRKMFINDSGNISSMYENNNETYKYARYEMMEDSSMTFINTLLAENFSLTFNGDITMPDVESINFYLTDSKNPEQQVLLTFSRADAKFYFSINGGTKSKLDTTFTGLKNADYKLSLTGSTGEVIADKSKLTVAKYLNGKTYEGFSSGMVILRIDFKMSEKITNGFAFIVKNVAGVTFSDSVTSDKSQPNIVALTEFGGTKPINSTYKLPKIMASDLISPELTKFTVSVKKPDGTIVIDEQPADAEYSILLDQYGIYAFSYTAQDQSGNVKTFSFSVHVLDMESPTVKLGKYKSEETLNKSIKIASLTISDNYSNPDDCIVYVYIADPTGKLTHVANNNSVTKIQDAVSPKDATFTPDKVGVWTVYYFIYDSSSDGISQGSATVLSYTVNVK